MNSFLPKKKQKERKKEQVLIIMIETCALEGKHQLTSRASLNKIGKAGKYWKCKYACSLFQIE